MNKRDISSKREHTIRALTISGLTLFLISWMVLGLLETKGTADDRPDDGNLGV